LRFEVLVGANMFIMVFWVVTLHDRIVYEQAILCKDKNKTT
jgi:hypothetical protein